MVECVFGCKHRCSCEIPDPRMAKASYKAALLGMAQNPDQTDRDGRGLRALRGRCDDLMDLENDFYLVRFNNEEDYNRVLVGGPWVVYGQFLTVHPWSLDFSTANTGIDVLDKTTKFTRRLLLRFFASCHQASYWPDYETRNSHRLCQEGAEGCESMKSLSSDVGNGSAFVVDENQS
ncbi:hypothetical protein J1N35_025310 [Gossypium stocksii]|uniref:DUF4283 domain-containing protein n=1 Tax=Gossypium stocksii TaxID=47602 RepID=A0A9D3V6C1_9ROSI|nr:hypothetical protein J1N35_025310 [Gossypium stocksii]